MARRSGKAPATPSVTPVVWDLREPLAASLPLQIDAVFHLAQSRCYRELPAKAGDMLDVKVVATARLADCARQAEAAWFCSISSGSVYEPYQGSLTETAPLAPASFYAATKAAAEMLLATYFTGCLFNPSQILRRLEPVLFRLRRWSILVPVVKPM